MQRLDEFLRLLWLHGASRRLRSAERADAADRPGDARLSAVLNGEAAALTGGVRWRVFSAKAEEDGSHALMVESNLAEPTLTLPPGDYVVHAAFGLASAAKRLTLGAGSAFRAAADRRREA